MQVWSHIYIDLYVVGNLYDLVNDNWLQLDAIAAYRYGNVELLPRIACQKQNWAWGM